MTHAHRCCVHASACKRQAETHCDARKTQSNQHSPFRVKTGRLRSMPGKSACSVILPMLQAPWQGHSEAQQRAQKLTPLPLHRPQWHLVLPACTGASPRRDHCFGGRTSAPAHQLWPSGDAPMRPCIGSFTFLCMLPLQCACPAMRSSDRRLSAEAFHGSSCQW